MKFLSKKKKYWGILIGIIVFIFLSIFIGRILATSYNTAGIVSSSNFLPVSGSSLINSFEYVASSIPTGTSARVQFSYDNVTWYNSQGVVNGGWDTLVEGTNSINLSGLGWKTPYFYYKLLLNSDGGTTPVIDSVGVSFVSFDGTFYTYSTSGTLISSNLLPTDGVTSDVDSINGFDYVVSSLPPGGGAQIQFSQDGNSWYGSSGILGTYDSLSAGGHSINLSGLGWTGPYFYYKAILSTSDTNNTPIFDSVALNFVSNNYYWVGLDNGNWNTGSYWSGYAGGTGGVGIPSIVESAIFNSGDTSSVYINSNIEVNNIKINSGYTGTITQSSTSTISVLHSFIINDGKVILTNLNQIGDGITLLGGELDIVHPQALGTSTFVIEGGTIDNTSGSPLTLSTNNSQDWNGNFVFGGTNDLNLGTGGVTLGTTTTITTNRTSTLTVGGVIGGSYGITKSGIGELTLGGINIYTGTTTLTQGTLNIDNSSALGVGNLHQIGGSLRVYGNNVITNNFSIEGGTTNFYNSAIFDGVANLSNNSIMNFIDLSYNSGIINGDARFSFASSGVATLTDSMSWGTVTGSSKGFDNIEITQWNFEDSSSHVGTSTVSIGDELNFYNTSYNSGNITVADGGIVNFYDTSYNLGNITVADGGIVNFYDITTNQGVIVGDVLFYNDESDNTGTISGSTTRVYTINATTTRDFTTDGGHDDWIIIARGVVVDISKAVYSLVTNVFKALFNGFFVFGSNSAGGPVVPQIEFVYPTADTSVTKWLPTIDWGNSETCEYLIDNEEYQTIDCDNNGSDIARPTAGGHTIFVKGTDLKGNVTEKSIDFVYDNVSPVYTICGVNDPLDEGTREYYYLTENITNTCYVSTNTILKGAGFTLTGDILANATTIGDGFDITLENISVFGNVYSTGYDSANGDGGNGGSITIATSTTGSVFANGGNGISDGGNGGSISVHNSFGTPLSSYLQANGGSSLVCGFGGSGGFINLINSSYGTLTADAGVDQTTVGAGLCPSEPSGTSGSRRTPVVTGVYTPPSTGGNTGGDTSNPSSPSTSNSGSRVATLFTPNTINQITLPVQQLKPLTFTPVPTFGTDTKGSFSFLTPISNFIFSAMPKVFIEKLSSTKGLEEYLKTLGISGAQQLILIQRKPITLPESSKDIAGIWSAYTSGIPTRNSDGVFAKSNLNITSVLSGNKTDIIYQTLKVTPGTKFTISLVGEADNIAKWNGNAVTLTKTGKMLEATVTAPRKPGIYTITSKASPLPLTIEVMSNQTNTYTNTNSNTIPKESIMGTVWSKIKSFFSLW